MFQESADAVEFWLDVDFLLWSTCIFIHPFEQFLQAIRLVQAEHRLGVRDLRPLQFHRSNLRYQRIRGIQPLEFLYQRIIFRIRNFRRISVPVEVIRTADCRFQLRNSALAILVGKIKEVHADNMSRLGWSA